MNWFKTRRKLEEDARYFEEQTEQARKERDELERMYMELRAEYRRLTDAS